MPRSASDQTQALVAQRFGERFTQYRERAGKTKREVAKATGFDESTIGRLEAGSRNPPRNPDFYRGLFNVLPQEDVETLWHVAHTPPWLSDERVANLTEKPSCLKAITEEGYRVDLEVRRAQAADVGNDDQSDLDAVAAILSLDVSLTLKDCAHRRAILASAFEETGVPSGTAPHEAEYSNATESALTEAELVAEDEQFTRALARARQRRGQVNRRRPAP